MGNYFPRLLAQLVVLERPRNNLISLLLKKTISVKQQDAYFFHRPAGQRTLFTTLGIPFQFRRDRHLLWI